ncbi:hypothetical protein QO002_002904 [Pararhizobium capsulatum DSM 1112]|uniref:Uncharacterized protein n=1 Tax=Pararhizobium capsulatum DSM 1112 TaxID=1121113 RepID=A0ABU0BSY2_9HYPH|nr:hypothetical protein [Pararhizobium capsulatum]MDQ0320766.1 hypothetical protein [Pararhizobium capsulatum DSM 1112]
MTKKTKIISLPDDEYAEIPQEVIDAMFAPEEPPLNDLPDPPAPYPGSERFGDWTLSNLIPLEPGVALVNDDPEGDPHKFAQHGRYTPPKPPTE